jgi:hypothetical protein
LRYLVKYQIRIGVRRRKRIFAGQVEWSRPCHGTLGAMLHHPTYAGAHSRGRRTTDPRRVGTSKRSLQLAIEDWNVLLQDMVPAYIPRDQYLANQETLKSNSTRFHRRGSARSGSAVLAGLLRCGHCEARMRVIYKQNDLIRYYCTRQCINFGAKPCQHFKGNPVEELVEEKVLRVLEPAALELSLQATDDIQQEKDRLHKNWQQRLERAGKAPIRCRRTGEPSRDARA